MMYLLLLGLARAALQTDGGNVYYCPEGYCLAEKERERGFTGPQASFVQCHNDDEDDMQAVTVWNYYEANNKEVEWDNLWKLEENFTKVPKTAGPNKHEMAKCCEGYKAINGQCELRAKMLEKLTRDMGCCYDVGFGARMVEVSQAPHKNMGEKEKIHFKECPVEDKRMGGATRFEAKTTCDDLKEKNWEVGRMCCKAMTAACLACPHNVSIEAWCGKFPKTDGCPEPKVCCKGMTADCLSCSMGVDKPTFCKKFPDTEGCAKMCCKAQTATCLACAKNMEVEDYCEEYPDTKGCDGRPCCEAENAVCNACRANQTVDEYCKENPETEDCPKVCCKAQTALCLACAKGVNKDKFCKRNPDVVGCGNQVCCLAMNASCLSCQANQSEQKYCAENPDTQGCPKVCCKALTAECLSCAADMTEEEWCKKMPNTEGCPEQPVCCEAMTADCLACKMGVDKDQFCEKKPNTQGCPRLCCKAQTADCLSCSKGVSKEEYCRQNPETQGCAVQKCKKDKACIPKNPDACGTYTCEEGECRTIMVACDPPRCEGEQIAELVEGTCCEFYACGDTDTCNAPSVQKGKKLCRSRGKKLKKTCMYLKKAKQCITPSSERCAEYDGQKKNCKKGGCKYDKKNDKCSMK